MNKEIGRIDGGARPIRLMLDTDIREVELITETIQRQVDFEKVKPGQFIGMSFFRNFSQGQIMLQVISVERNGEKTSVQPIPLPPKPPKPRRKSNRRKTTKN